MGQITKEQIQFYRENGFVQVDGILSSEELATLRDCADELIRTKSSVSAQPDRSHKAYQNIFYQRFNAWRDHGGISMFTFRSKFAAMARALCGASDVRLLHDHLLFKMPGDSKPTPWHQDLPYWPLRETGALSLWIPLDDVDENNGCMMFVPGSHRYGKLTAIDLVNPQNLEEFVQNHGEKPKQPVIIRMKAGSATFHDGLTFHYAYPNVTDRPRRVLAIIYVPDGTTYNGQPHILADHADPALVPGEPIKGPLFPIIR
jgi:ectoine hydroxylase-related dioxygenase (phytanoyl-CoA dioxygenase family)